MFPDAKLWVNVGVGDNVRDHQIGDLRDLYTRKPQILNFQPVDFDKYNYEVYLYEKPFFNNPHLFIAIVMEHKTQPVFEYIRPHGPYWDMLNKHYKGAKNLSAIVTEEKYNIPMEVMMNGATVEKHTFPVPIYGHHHMNRSSFELVGGACPSRGGDWGTYPWGSAGGGWPTNYEEITPFCDGFAIDMKMWANLFVETWDNHDMGAGNAGFPGATHLDYEVEANFYGKFNDPYLLAKGLVNEHQLDLTNGTIIHEAAQAMGKVNIPIEFSTKSFFNFFNKVPDIKYRQTAKLTDFCPEKCESDMDSSFYDYVGADKTEHNRDPHDPTFLRTNSELPLLPRFEGFMGTHGK